MSRATLKPIMSKLREAIIKGVAGKMEKYGFDENGLLAVEKPLSQYGETIRENIRVLFEARGINTPDRYVEYIHNTSRTFLHILVCFKLMEKRGIMSSLLSSVLDMDIYNEIIPDFVSVNPLAFDEFELKYSGEIDKLAQRDNEEESGEYYQFLYLMEVLTREMAQEVPLLFKDYEHNLIQPDFDNMCVILQTVSAIADEEYGEDDFLGWVYQYWVDTDAGELEAAEEGRGIAYANQIYYDVLLQLDQEQTEYGEFYTPGWVVKRIVDNTLKYYRDVNHRPVEDIKLLDPACGAGNFLVYAFGAFLKIYEEEHPDWTEKDKILSVLNNNIYGADIQREPLQITALNLWMKAKTWGVEKKISGLNIFHVNVLMADSLYPWEEEEEFHQFSMFDTPESLLERKYTSEDIGRLLSIESAENHNNAVRFFKNQFDAIVMNPPFVDARKMSGETLELLKTYYADNARNTFGAFIEKALILLKKNGILGFISSDTFFTLSSFSSIRNIILSRQFIEADLLGNAVFDGPTVTSAMLFIRNRSLKNNEVMIRKYKDGAIERGYSLWQNQLYKVKGAPLLFDLSDDIRNALSRTSLGDIEEFEVRKGIVTGNNARFLRYKWEIPKNMIGTEFIKYNLKHEEYITESNYVLDWRKKQQKEILKSSSARCAYMIDHFKGRAEDSSFRPGVVFALNGNFKCGILNRDSLFDGNTPAVLMGDTKYQYYMLALLSSKFAIYLLRKLNSSVSTQPGDVRKIPFIYPDQEQLSVINQLVGRLLDKKSGLLSWKPTSDLFECSEIEYGFRRGAESLQQAYDQYAKSYKELVETINVIRKNIDMEIYKIYHILKDDIDVIERELRDIDTRIDSKPVSYEEAAVYYLRNIFRKSSGAEHKLYTCGELNTQICKCLESQGGYGLVSEVENVLGVSLMEFLSAGARIQNKKVFLFGGGRDDIHEPYIQKKKIGGSGKKQEYVIWHISQFLIEFQEDKRYAMQNEIRRLTNEVYLPKLQRAKEKLQAEDAPAAEQKKLLREAALYEECVRTLENWKIVD